MLLIHLAALLAAPAPQDARVDRPPPPDAAGPTYRYFDEERPLGLETGYFVVRQPGLDPAGLAALLGPALAPLGVEPGFLPGWHRVPLETGSSDLVRRRVAAAVARGVDFAGPVFTTPEGLLQHPTDDVLVLFDEGSTEPSRQAALAAAGSVRRAGVGGLPRSFLVSTGLRDGFLVRALADELAALAHVAHAEPERVLELERFLLPNDPSFGEQWGLHNTGQAGGIVGVTGVPDVDIDAPAAWDLSLGAPTVLIGILDDGVQQDHPDLGQVPGVDFTGQGGGGGPVSACDNHGTAVAGVATATIDNLMGVAGVAPGCRTKSLRFAVPAVTPLCNGSVFFMTTWLTDALDHAAQQGVRITNFSNGLSPNTAITIAFDMAATAGVLHFAAAGNAGQTNVAYPASLASVHAVGGIQRDGQLYPISNHGTGLELVAPGLEVLTLDRTGADGYDALADVVNLSGTSFSSPFAAGVAGLLVSVDPGLSNAEAVALLACTAKDLGTPGFDATFGHGLLDADDALLLALGCGNPPVVAIRNGGINPNVYSATSPVLGETMSLGVVDFTHGQVLILAYAAPHNAPLASGQVLLINLAAPRLFGLNLPGLPFAGLDLTIPCDPTLCGQTAYSQGVLYGGGGGGGFLLTNAVDLTIGSL